LAPPAGSTPAEGLVVGIGAADVATTPGAEVVGLAGGVVGAVVVGLAGGVVGGGVGFWVQVQPVGLVGGGVGWWWHPHCVGVAVVDGLTVAGETVAACAAPLNITVEPAARNGTLSAAVAISLRGRLDWRIFIYSAPFLLIPVAFAPCGPATRQRGRWRNTE
jgi:hypothetical protein